MNPIITDVTPGELAADRGQYRNASLTPALLGISPHTTRQEALELLKYGLEKQWTDFQRRMVLDKGHEIEALARPIAEALIGDKLPPKRCTLGNFGATLDGYTVDDSTLEPINWECKSLNAAIRAAFAQGVYSGGIYCGVDLPEYLCAQIEHQLMCSAADKCLFTAANLNREALHCWYRRDPIMRSRVVSVWDRVDGDLAAMPDVMPMPEYQQTLIPAKTASLPALRVELSGMVTHSNFAEYQSKAIAVFKGANKSPTTDQDFADAAEFIKMAKGVRETIKQVKSQALKQTQTIDELFAGLDAIDAEAMRAERDLEAIVKARKDKLKSDKLRAAQEAYSAHIAALSVAKYMPLVAVNFADAIKGKSSFDSMQQSLDAELLRAQSAANVTAAKVQKNLDLIAANGNDLLFPNPRDLVTKTPEDLANHIAVTLAKFDADQKRIIEQREQLARETAQREQDRIDQNEQIRLDNIARKEAEDLRMSALRADCVQELEQEYEAKRANSALPTLPPSVMINIGQINERLRVVTVTTAQLGALGFPGTEGPRKGLSAWAESDYPRITAAIVARLSK